MHRFTVTLIMVGLERLELSTSRLSGVRSNHLSYRPSICSSFAFSRRQARFLLRLRIFGYAPCAKKLRLPREKTKFFANYLLVCQRTQWFLASKQRVGFFLYKGGDPAAGSPTATLLRLHPNHQPYRRRLPPRRVSSSVSGKTNFRGVTGGVYKARERIHPGMMIRDY